MTEPTALQLLLVEDNPTDILLTQQALQVVDDDCRLTVQRDGVAALAYLREAEELPDLILLDLNLPRLNGLELLAQLKADAALREIPVIVLTTSQNEQDRQRAREAGASRYVCKPMDFDDFTAFIGSLYSYWQNQPTSESLNG